MATKCPACDKATDLILLSTHRDLATAREHGYRLTPVLKYRCPCGVIWAETSLPHEHPEPSKNAQ